MSWSTGACIHILSSARLKWWLCSLFTCCHGESEYQSPIDGGFFSFQMHMLNSEWTFSESIELILIHCSETKNSEFPISGLVDSEFRFVKPASCRSSRKEVHFETSTEGWVSVTGAHQRMKFNQESPFEWQMHGFEGLSDTKTRKKVYNATREERNSLIVCLQMS